MEILNEETVNDAEVRDMLEARSKAGDLKYEQKNAYEVLKKIMDVDIEKIKLLVQELKNMEKLREKQIVAIVNFLPETKDELRAVLSKEYNDLTPEEADRILEVIRKIV